MKRVLTTIAIAFAVVCALTIASPDAFAGYAADVGTPSPEGVKPPDGGQGNGGVFGGEATDGDPDDLGGGFRTSNGQHKQAVGGGKPPVTSLVEIMLNAQRIWMMVLR